MRLIAEHSTSFNIKSKITESEIMEMAGIKNVCYYKCKKMLKDAMQLPEWPYDWKKPVRCMTPKYDRVIRRERGEAI